MSPSESTGSYEHLDIPTSDARKERNCPYCGMLHLSGTGKCPLVSAYEYHPNGTLKRVEFHGPRPAAVGPFHTTWRLGETT